MSDQIVWTEWKFISISTISLSGDKIPLCNAEGSSMNNSMSCETAQ